MAAVLVKVCRGSRGRSRVVEHELGLAAAGLVKNVRDGVKLLADGELTRPVTIKVDKASQAASRKVAAAGGTVEVTPTC